MRRQDQRERDLERELRSHVEAEAEETKDLYAARRALGNATLIREDVRAIWGWTFWECLARDIRVALRGIRKSPGWAGIAIVTLALGIGANSAIFSILDAVLLRPLPYPHPERLFRIWQSQPKMGQGRLATAPPEFAAYRDRTRVFASLSGYQPASYDVTGEQEPQHITASRATASLFPTLGIPPLLGRTFTAQDEFPNAPKVVVLSYSYWRTHYGGDPHVLGQAIRLSEQEYRIIGIMPAGLSFPATTVTPGEPPALWTPLSFTAEELRDWASSFDTSIIGRLRDGVTAAQAREDVRRVVQEFQKEHADIYERNVVLDATAEPWAPELAGRVPSLLWMLCCAVALVLLIACANVANLMLARAGARQREIAVRRALGASPIRLMRQVFLETAMLAVAGAAAGTVLAAALVRGIQALWTSSLNLRAVSVDFRALAFTCGICGLTCVLCGIAPAWAARQADANEALQQGARQSGPGRRQSRLARLLIVVEVASCVVLLVGSGLLFRSFVRVLHAPLGFDPEQALLVRTAFNRQRYASPEKRRQAERTIVERLSALPGVAAVAVTSHVPLADERDIGFTVDGRPPGEFHWADNALVSGDYFRVMRISLLRGRSFSLADTPQTPLVAVINQSMAATYWPHQDAVGKGFRWGGRHITVIGIVGDVHILGLDRPIGPAIYNSVYQLESGAATSGVFVIRVRGQQDPMRLGAAAQRAVWSVDGGLPILSLQTLEEVVSGSLGARRASMALATSFAVLALLLSLAGVYGVLSYAVAGRTAEIGLRQALGATPSEILKLVLAEGFRLAAGGMVVGLAGAAVSGVFLSKLVFGVPVLDPLTYALAIATAVSASLLASYLPARRASKLDPMTALRCE